jgi:hypothetical protein
MNRLHRGGGIRFGSEQSELTLRSACTGPGDRQVIETKSTAMRTSALDSSYTSVWPLTVIRAVNVRPDLAARENTLGHEPFIGQYVIDPGAIVAVPSPGHRIPTSVRFETIRVKLTKHVDEMSSSCRQEHVQPLPTLHLLEGWLTIIDKL